MTEILLTTLNARYIHTSFGLRYLKANLGELTDRSRILEFGIKQPTMDIVERLLQESPRIIGFGIYIWNVQQSFEVVSLLRKVAPRVRVVLGGPEISYADDALPITKLADVIICGEGDLAFAEVCRSLLAGHEPEKRWFQAPLPTMDDLVLPYDLYTDEDITNRVLYVEASRGCPFRCEFCLSSLDIPVRRPPLAVFLKALEDLIARGAHHFKFVDRTFNLNIKVSRAILDFFLERYQDGMFLHFEMVPDRLPDDLRQAIAAFPPGALQFEVGVQTFNPEVAARIHLKRNYDRMQENLQFLEHHSGAHIHADLIAGLPGEDLSSFAAGFDRLLAMGPAEIQVGILKRLKGTPISRHDETFAMVYHDQAPYELVCNSTMPFETMQKVRRFAKVWDRVANSGQFTRTVPLLWRDGSPFAAFMAWSEWVYARTGQVHAVGVERYTTFLFDYLTQEQGYDEREVALALVEDFRRNGRRLTRALKHYLPDGVDSGRTTRESRIPKRQSRHLDPAQETA